MLVSARDSSFFMGCCSCGNPKSGRVWLVIAFVCIVLAAGLMIGGLTGPYYKIASKASFGNLSAKSTTLYTGSKIKYEGQVRICDEKKINTCARNAFANCCACTK